MNPRHNAQFPRQVTDYLWWTAACNRVIIEGKSFHTHFGIYLLKGSERTLLIDTVTPSHWPYISKHIETALGGRKLDYIFPTHPEVPHASALPLLCRAYPEATVVTDKRDYHLYFPELLDRVVDKRAGDELDLGDLQFVFLPALMQDLPNTLWGYERTKKIMFVADGFGFAHAESGGADDDDPMHTPGECALLASELVEGVDVQKASLILRAALYWSRYVDADLLFKRIDALFARYPTEMIAPAHGNFVDRIELVAPLIRKVHEHAYETAMAGQSRESGETIKP